MFSLQKLVSSPWRPCVRHILTTRGKSPRVIAHRAGRALADIVRVNALVLLVPAKTMIYLAGSYGVFCVGYSLTSPDQWRLSDHNVLLTGILRVVRTVSNAALLFVVYKYTFWGMSDDGGSSTDPQPSNSGFGPPPTSDSDGNEDLSSLSPEKRRYKEAKHRFWEFASNRVAHVMLTNGGIYIKVGQAMATFSAMLPKEFQTALKPLLSNIFERQSGEVDYMFVKDLGDKPENLFAEFDSEPFAGASIAQVFLGKTHNGEKVAVKVQYFDIAKRFKMDKGTVMFLLRVLDWYEPGGVPLIRVLPHVFDSLEKELNFENEGANSELCKNDLRNLNFVKIPRVHWDLTSKRILTMEFAEGINLIDTDAVIKSGFSAREVMEKVIVTFSEQVFRSGNIHSDPHPGNLMVRRGRGGRTEIVVIDHGLYEQLPAQYCDAFSTFWHSVIIDNYDEVQKSGKRLGIAYPDMLATLLFFKPYGEMKKLGFGGMHGEKRKKMEEMSAEERKQMEEIRQMGHDTVDSFPKELALVFRNIRLIQGINLSFGVPVNRVRLMAEVAVKYSKKNDDFMSYLISRLKFEWHFFVLDMRNRLLGLSMWIYSLFVKREEGKMDISKAALFLKA